MLLFTRGPPGPQTVPQSFTSPPSWLVVEIRITIQPTHPDLLRASGLQDCQPLSCENQDCRGELDSLRLNEFGFLHQVAYVGMIWDENHSLYVLPSRSNEFQVVICISPMCAIRRPVGSTCSIPVRRILCDPLQTCFSEKHGPDAVGHFPHRGRGGGARAGQRRMAVRGSRLQEITSSCNLLRKILRELQLRTRDEGKRSVIF